VALTAGTTFVKALSKIFNRLRIHRIAIKEDGVGTVLGFYHLSEISDLFPRGDGFSLILEINRTPRDTFTAIRTCIEFHQSKFIEMADRDLR
jgi:hypothetical protein